MLGLPNQVVELFERFTLVLVILFVGIDGLRTLRLVEAKRDELWQRLFRACAYKNSFSRLILSRFAINECPAHHWTSSDRDDP